MRTTFLKYTSNRIEFLAFFEKKRSFVGNSCKRSRKAVQIFYARSVWNKRRTRTDGVAVARKPLALRAEGRNFTRLSTKQFSVPRFSSKNARFKRQKSYCRNKNVSRRTHPPAMQTTFARFSLVRKTNRHTSLSSCPTADYFGILSANAHNFRINGTIPRRALF